MKEVIVEIDENGNPTVEAKGFSGPDCKLFTDAIEKALGKVESVELKPEYRQSRAIGRKVGA